MGVLASFQMGVHGLISVNLAVFDMNHLTNKRFETIEKLAVSMRPKLVKQLTCLKIVALYRTVSL